MKLVVELEPSLREVLMPPTRGHDLKLGRGSVSARSSLMPPTRGHDLKLLRTASPVNSPPMPPTRGHDLKHEAHRRSRRRDERCPPHGGTT